MKTAELELHKITPDQALEAFRAPKGPQVDEVRAKLGAIGSEGVWGVVTETLEDGTEKPTAYVHLDANDLGTRLEVTEYGGYEQFGLPPLDEALAIANQQAEQTGPEA